MKCFSEKVELWFTGGTSDRWEEAILHLFKKIFFLGTIIPLEEGVVRVTFVGNPSHLLEAHMRIYMDIRMFDDGISFKISQYGMDLFEENAFSKVPVSLFRQNPVLLLEALTNLN